MKAPIVPQSYDQWKHCITVLCRISLTPAYVEARLLALSDPRDHITQRFVETWGEAHLAQVRNWFLQARDELAGGAA